MTRQEAEDYVYKSYLKAERFQQYRNRDANKRNPQLSRDILQHMQGTPCVVVTGSKGKGSVSCMISQILQTEKTVGMMTSPHISCFNERFRVNGISISDADLVRHIERIRGDFDLIESRICETECISPMGIQAALALSYFQDKNTDFNIFECGKGAKYDDVNNIVHQYAIINSIFLEHTRELGPTLEEIADDKASVITSDCRCVFVAGQEPQAMAMIEKHASVENIPLKTYGKDFYAQNIRYTGNGMIFDVMVNKHVYSDVTIPLMGDHQARNCALAMALCEEVMGSLPIPFVREKLSALKWPGRMEILSKDPFILLDACINRESSFCVREVLEKLGVDKITAIVGIPDDKDFLGVVQTIEEVSTKIILTKSCNPHYRFTEMQLKVLEEWGIRAESTLNINQALQKAAENNLPTVILGTTSLVSEVEKLFTENN